MKKFIIINGKHITCIKQNSLQDAITYCQNFGNHSEELIVREYTTIKNLIND